jgi:methionine--tRNA ligase beta chain
VAIITSLIRLLGAVMEPFMPGFTDKIAWTMNLPHMDIPDTFTLCVPAGHQINKPAPMFSVITDEAAAHFREKFGGAQADAAAAAAAAAAAGGSAGGSGGAAAPAAAGGAGGKGKGKGGGGAAPAAGAAPDLPDIARVDLRVGQIVKVWPHPDAEKLYCEEIDVGEDKPRQIASGLRPYYTQEQMAGRRICVVCNLKPRPMVGFESQGMVLCAANADRSVVEFIEPPPGAKVGERLMVEGLITDAGPVAEVINPAKKNNPWTNVAPVRVG